MTQGPSLGPRKYTAIVKGRSMSTCVMGMLNARNSAQRAPHVVCRPGRLCPALPALSLSRVSPTETDLNSEHCICVFQDLMKLSLVHSSATAVAVLQSTVNYQLLRILANSQLSNNAHNTLGIDSTEKAKKQNKYEDFQS